MRMAEMRNLGPDEYNELRKSWIDDIINQSDRIICPSRHQKKHLSELFGEEEKYTSLYYGLKFRGYRPVPLRRGRPVFGYLGSLSYIKGVSLIEKALDDLGDRSFEVLMGLVYDESNPMDRECVGRLEKFMCVSIAKNISRRKLYTDFFSRIDYLIIPSVWNETGPMTMFESFYYRKPVIIPNIESMVEKLGKNRSSIIFRDAEHLKRVIEDIIEGKRKRPAADTWDVKPVNKYAEEVEKIYKDILSSEKGGLFLKIGYTCNNNCTFCVTGDNLPKEFVDFGKIESKLAKYKKRYDSVVLTGGEPTIRKDFFKIIDTCFRSGYKILLQTNARMFSYDWFCSDIEAYNMALSINVNDSDQTVFDSMTRVKGSFAETVKGIKNIRQMGFDILGKIMLTKKNFMHLKRTVMFMHGLGIRDIMIVFLTPYGSAGKDFSSVVPSYTDVGPYLEKVLEWASGKDGITVGLEGFPSCTINTVYQQLVSESNFSEKTLDGIYPGDEDEPYNCKQQRVLDQKMKFPDCRRCRYFGKCEGVYKKYVEEMGHAEFMPVT